jgi:multidrug efflux pump subunit AcrA (membrane-fusion protein)
MKRPRSNERLTPSRLRARLLRARRRLIVTGLSGLLVAGIVLALAGPFTPRKRGAGSLDNGAPTGLATVQRRSLTSQQTLVGTVGYAGTWTVAVPAGSSAADVQQVEQELASSRAASITASSTLTADATALATAAAAAQAARLKEASDCAGANAAVVATAPATSSSAEVASTGAGLSPCQSSMQTAQTSQSALDTARAKVVADRAQLASAQTTLDSAQRSMDVVQSASTTYGTSASFTSLPSVGAVVFRGQTLYAINSQETILLYGVTPAWRSFTTGMSRGRDIAELNDNLRALGYGAVTGDRFTSATQQAIAAIQRAHGLPATGSFSLGSVVFQPAASRITGVTPAVGQSVQPGPIMTLSSTRHSVSLQLNAAEQSQVKVGDRVMITLPDNTTTPGVVGFVGKVATTSDTGSNANGNSASGTPTLPVAIKFLHPADAGTLDQAPVNVLVTTANVRNALVVPVNALVALAGGGDALEAVDAGVHRLVAVTPGLFDDAEGLVQVEGRDVRAGQRVVVPTSS